MEALRSGDPSVVAGYRMLARLGVGGMGRVYLARSPGGRPVAFKVIRGEFADDPDFRVRFAREVAAARAVSGVFTAPVLDADPQGDPPWLATGYVAGVALSDAVSRFGPLPGSLGQLAGGIAEALIAVHAAGLVHRDLKPGNVMLAADGPRLIDFGIARALEGGTITRTGFLVGSPGFLAPEQAGSGQIGPATDVFALGSVLTYAATGQTPFGEGVFTELLFKVLYGQPDVSGVPERYRPLVAAMLAKEPAERPSPREILDRLTELGVNGGSGAWLPRPLTELVLARSAALLSDDPLAPETVVEHPPNEPPPPGTGTSHPADPLGPAGGPPTRTPARHPFDLPPPDAQPPASAHEAAQPTEPAAFARRPTEGPGVPAEPRAPHTQPRIPAPPPGPELPRHQAPPAFPPGTPGTPDTPTRANRRRRVLIAALAVAALAIGAAIAVPQLLDDDKKSPQHGSSPNNPGPTASKTSCGAIAADFTSNTIYPQVSAANTGVEPQYTQHGYLITAGAGADARTDFPAGRITAPFASVPVNGDFVVETRLAANPKSGYQAGGLLLFADNTSYIRLERGYGDFDAIAFEYLAGGKYVKLTTPFNGEAGGVVKTSADDVVLRLERRGDRVTAQWRPGSSGQGQTPPTDTWQDLPGSAPFAAPDARVGMTVLNSQPNAAPFTVNFQNLNVTCP
ncbi:MAG: protein kinase [Streptomycetaceae bacterium]|nr:protein kinase [Streptomycetaceae bacterium]